MTGFNHVLTGVTIAVVVQQPIVAPLLALASHFVLDAIPHFGHSRFEKWGRDLHLLILFDGLLCLSVLTASLLLFPHLQALIILCAGMAILPDLLWIFYYKYDLRHKFFAFHQGIQRYEKPLGAIVEICYVVAISALLLSLK